MHSKTIKSVKVTRAQFSRKNKNNRVAWKLRSEIGVWESVSNGKIMNTELTKEVLRLFCLCFSLTLSSALFLHRMTVHLCFRGETTLEFGKVILYRSREFGKLCRAFTEHNGEALKKAPFFSPRKKASKLWAESGNETKLSHFDKREEES